MTSIMEFFTALGKYDFLQSALITAIMVGIMSGLIGSFIILRGMSLMGGCDFPCGPARGSRCLYARY